MPLVGFEPTNPESKQYYTHALKPCGHWDRLAINRQMNKINTCDNKTTEEIRGPLNTRWFKYDRD